ncbi:MAG: signal peptidase I [Eggerthellaceae bacterium]
MDSGQHAHGRQPGIVRRFLSFLLCIVIVIVAVWGIRTYVAEPFEVPSASMENTIMTGDRLFAEKLSYQFSEPQRGDIVVFSDPQVPSRVLVKRVIATEGQTISMSGGVLYVDGLAQNESYTLGETYPLSQTAGNVSLSYPYVVPAGEIWVMGDNRENSSDSRYFGPIDVDTVFGKALFTYWPLDRIGLLS